MRLDPVGLVFGSRVGGLPTSEAQGKLDDRHVDRGRIDLLPGQNPLVGNEGTLRAGGKKRFEVFEGVPVGGHLREGTEGETGGPFDYRPGGLLGRSFQSQPVANVLVHAP
jgi:hypothetical protein